MGYKSIEYHTRLSDNNTVKVCGGSFGGPFDLETANRLVKCDFTVKVKPSGTLVFVDFDGKEVTLYITVDPEFTDAGKLARQEYNHQQTLKAEAEESKRAELEDLLDGISIDEAIRRLS